jgi:large subunit ribosomal protein L15
VQLQASLALIQGPGQSAAKIPKNPDGRIPFTHPSLTGLDNLSTNMKNFLTSKLRLSELARSHEAEKVLRWQPKMVCSYIIALLSGGSSESKLT